MQFILTPLTVPSLALAAAGCRLVWTSIRDLRFALASREWPTTIGTVSRLDIHPGSAFKHDSLGVVCYTYQVASQTYQSNVHDYGGRASRGGGGDVLNS